MNVTDVRLRNVNAVGKMRGIASITLEDAFVIHDVRIIEGKNGLFTAMPSKRTSDGVFRDIAHPINSNMRQKIQEAVLEAYLDGNPDHPAADEREIEYEGVSVS